MRLVGIKMKVFKTRKPEFLLKVYNSYVRIVVEYALQVWLSSEVALGSTLERVQRKFIERLRDAFGLDYKQRLVSFQLPTLKIRRLFHDMVLAFKDLYAMIHVDPVDIRLTLRGTTTRGSSLRLHHYKSRPALISHTFKSRLPIQW